MAFPSHRKLLATSRGYSWEFFVGVCRPVLRAESRPYFRPKNVIFHTRFQTWRWSQSATYAFISMSYLLRLERQQNDFFLSYSFIIETMNTSIRYRRFLCKQYPILDQNGQNLYPFSDQNGAKTIPFAAASTPRYKAYKREYPSPRGATATMCNTR